jgi:hypothetical protein
MPLTTAWGIGGTMYGQRKAFQPGGEMAEVAQCPKCGKAIDETHEVHWCIKCGENLPPDILARLPKLAALAAAATGGSEAAATDTRSSSLVVNRYRDAYRVGSALVGLGTAIKIAGVIFAALILLGALTMGETIALAGVVIAVLNGGLFWVCGVVVAAQGQILQATLDTAVGASHFLTDLQRAEAMGLPRALADHPAAESRHTR